MHSVTIAVDDAPNGLRLITIDAPSLQFRFHATVRSADHRGYRSTMTIALDLLSTLLAAHSRQERPGGGA